jgi:hypothetical protein
MLNATMLYWRRRAPSGVIPNNNGIQWHQRSDNEIKSEPSKKTKAAPSVFKYLQSKTDKTILRAQKEAICGIWIFVRKRKNGRKAANQAIQRTRGIG